MTVSSDQKSIPKHLRPPPAQVVLPSRLEIVRTRPDGTPLKPYEIVHFSGPKTPADTEKERQETDAITYFYDRRNERAREILVFRGETAIWTELVRDCNERAGVDASRECAMLSRILAERVRYQNSKYNAMLRPTLTPGLPEHYERRYTGD